MAEKEGRLLPVTNVQRFSIHDGDGIRTTVFLKGCPLRCQWCHNPETQRTTPQIFYTADQCLVCGACAAVCPRHAHLFGENHVFMAERCDGCGRCTEVCPSQALEPVSRMRTVDEILSVVLRDRAFYGQRGGLTLSGGEPMMHPEGSLALLRRAKEEGITTAVETCGYFDERWLKPLAETTDCFLWDVKDTNPERHRRYTGVDNGLILENLLQLDQWACRIRLRCILVRSVNMETEHYRHLASLFQQLRHCEGIELLPYHSFGASKNQRLGYEDSGREDWIPRREEVEEGKRFLRDLGAAVVSG